MIFFLCSSKGETKFWVLTIQKNVLGRVTLWTKSLRGCSFRSFKEFSDIFTKPAFPVLQARKRQVSFLPLLLLCCLSFTRPTLKLQNCSSIVRGSLTTKQLIGRRSSMQLRRHTPYLG